MKLISTTKQKRIFSPWLFVIVSSFLILIILSTLVSNYVNMSFPQISQSFENNENAKPNALTPSPNEPGSSGNFKLGNFIKEGIGESISSLFGLTSTVNLTWDKPSGTATITGYEIDLHNGDNFGKNIKTIFSPNPKLDVIVLRGDSQYYRVLAMNADGKSEPTKFHGVTTMSNHLLIEFQEPKYPDSILIYNKIEKKVNDGIFKEFVTISTDYFSYVDTEINPGEIYHYRIIQVYLDGTERTVDEFSFSPPYDIYEMILHSVLPLFRNN